MSKDTRIHFDFHDFIDPDTGIRVTRLSPSGMACPRNYFYQKCFTNDGRHLLFGGEHAGVFNLWLLDLQTAEARQLTEGKGDNYHGSFISQDDRSVFYVKARNELRRVDLASLEETVVYTVPADWQGYGTWVANSACTKIAAMEILTADMPTGVSGWERFRCLFDKKALQRMIRIDIASGEAETVFQGNLFVGHPMYRPFDDKIMAFCHEGPHDLVDARMWLIDEDGGNLRCVKQQAEGEACMHEFWVPDGSRLIYVSYTKGRQDREIWAVDPVTLENSRIMSMPPCAHLMSNADGTLVVGDGAGQLGDVADKTGHAFEPSPYLHLFDLRTRTHRAICRHDSSWGDYKGNVQATHPHPSFTPDERRVLFSSDREGVPALYLADLPV